MDRREGTSHCKPEPKQAPDRKRNMKPRPTPAVRSLSPLTPPAGHLTCLTLYQFWGVCGFFLRLDIIARVKLYACNLDSGGLDRRLTSLKFKASLDYIESSRLDLVAV